MSEATGARVEVEIVIGTDAGQVWDLITDVARIGEWSPECTGASWLGGTGPQPGAGPQAGARFEGYNEFGGGFTSTTTCVVTEAARPAVFEYRVLDPTGNVESPGSTWRYELQPGAEPGQTSVRQTFVHGPGMTGLKLAMQNDPGAAATILADRLDLLRKHMTVTAESMGAAAGSAV